MEERIKKLIEIRDRGGSDNEKEIARRILEKYEAQGHDINKFSELKFIDAEFKIKNAFEKKFLFQIIANVFGDRAGNLRYAEQKGRIFLELYPFDEIELREKFDFYLKDYYEQQKIFYAGYIHKNNLGSTVSGLGKERSSEELLKIFRMADGIDKKDLLKSLNPGGYEE